MKKLYKAAIGGFAGLATMTVAAEVGHIFDKSPKPAGQMSCPAEPVGEIALSSEIIVGQCLDSSQETGLEDSLAKDFLILFSELGACAAGATFGAKINMPFIKDSVWLARAYMQPKSHIV